MYATDARVGTRSSSRVRRDLVRQGILLLVLIPLAIVFLMPMLWMLSTSLKTNQQFAAWPPIWIPNPMMIENYPTAWNSAPFPLYLRNTLILTVGALVGQVISCSAVAYGFARIRFPGRETLFIVVLATMMLPGAVTLIPTYILFKEVGWLDTFAPLIVPAFFGAGGGAFFIFLLRQFFKTIPMELSEAAKIDGANNFRTFWQIIMPLAKPALATVMIFSFRTHWNDFEGPLIYLSSRDNFTLTLGLRYFIRMNSTDFQYLMAISFLMTLPIILVFFFAQQYFVRGVVMTGIKG